MYVVSKLQQRGIEQRPEVTCIQNFIEFSSCQINRQSRWSQYSSPLTGTCWKFFLYSRIKSMNWTWSRQISDRPPHVWFGNWKWVGCDSHRAWSGSLVTHSSNLRYYNSFLELKIYTNRFGSEISPRPHLRIQPLFWKVYKEILRLNSKNGNRPSRCLLLPLCAKMALSMQSKVLDISQLQQKKTDLRRYCYIHTRFDDDWGV